MLMEKDLIEALRKECESNRIAREVLTLFAVRKRARSILTVYGIEQRMRKEGFLNNVPEDYGKFLAFLDSLGIGKLMVKADGTVVGLKDIKIDLRSIGLVAINNMTKLEGFKPRNTYKKLDLPKQIEKPTAITTVTKESDDVTITVEPRPGVFFKITAPREEINSLLKRLI